MARTGRMVRIAGRAPVWWHVLGDQVGSPELWVYFSGGDRTLEEAVRASLADCGIQLVLAEGSSRETQGVVCFTEITDELLAVLHERSKTGRVLALAINGSLPTGTSWRLLNAGASDVLAWDGGGLVARQVLARIERWQAIDDLAESAHQDLIGTSPTWRAAVRRVVEAAHFTEAPVLLIGESGTGKELLARMVHSAGRGHNGSRAELVTVDCSTLAPELSGSELFGHERGAYTGAVSMREGAFSMAHGGTLFLDEVGELPLPLQAQLLRAVQEKTYKRVGGNVWMSSDFRLVCATNRDLEELVKQGRFRLDLYHRLAGSVLRTPPLRDRREDILLLAGHFFQAALDDDAAPEFDPAMTEYLLHRGYPGNVRELRQLVERIAHRHVGPGPITAGDIPEEDRPAGGEVARAWPGEDLERAIADAVTMGVGLKEISQVTAETAIRIAVQSENGNLQRAARRLGVTDRALQLRRAEKSKKSG